MLNKILTLANQYLPPWAAALITAVATLAAQVTGVREAGGVDGLGQTSLGVTDALSALIQNPTLEAILPAPILAALAYLFRRTPAPATAQALLTDTPPADLTTDVQVATTDTRNIQPQAPSSPPITTRQFAYSDEDPYMEEILQRLEALESQLEMENENDNDNEETVEELVHSVARLEQQAIEFDSVLTDKVQRSEYIELGSRLQDMRLQINTQSARSGGVIAIRMDKIEEQMENLGSRYEQMQAGDIDHHAAAYKLLDARTNRMSVEFDRKLGEAANATPLQMQRQMQSMSGAIHALQENDKTQDETLALHEDKLESDGRSLNHLELWMEGAFVDIDDTYIGDTDDTDDTQVSPSSDDTSAAYFTEADEDRIEAAFEVHNEPEPDIVLDDTLADIPTLHARTKAPAQPLPGAPKELPLSLRQNNPGAILATKDAYNRWRGEMTSGNAYARFASMELGLRAMAYLLLIAYHRRHGLDSVEAIISRWAPTGSGPTDNSIVETRNYVRRVSQLVGVDPTDTIDPERVSMLTALMRGIVEVESGLELMNTGITYSAMLDAANALQAEFPKGEPT